MYGGHHFDMTGAPAYMQDEIIDAEEFLDRIDNHKVLMEYGINMKIRDLSQVAIDVNDISRSFHSEVWINRIKI